MNYALDMSAVLVRPIDCTHTHTAPINMVYACVRVRAQLNRLFGMRASAFVHGQHSTAKWRGTTTAATGPPSRWRTVCALDCAKCAAIKLRDRDRARSL